MVEFQQPARGGTFLEPAGRIGTLVTKALVIAIQTLIGSDTENTFPRSEGDAR
jgi:hypothetical protein